jgi:HEAT repeat protein
MGTNAVPALVPLLSDPTPGVRVAAVETLGRVGGGESTSRLIKARLEDEHWYVRRAAQEAVKRMEGR